MHFISNVDLSNIDWDALFKVRTITEAIRNKSAKIEPEGYQAVDEQMIPCKSKRTKIRKYNLKKNEKWGFRNFVYAGNYGMIYDFYIYTGKENNEFVGLQKFSAVVARLS